VTAAIRARAGNCCEWCGRPNGVTVVVRPDGSWLTVSSWISENGCCETEPGAKHVRTVLTVAHLDHTPENCDPANLAALCQRCHNRYDAPTRAKGRKERMQRTAALPLGEP